jgi:hypothetical protein
VYFEIQTHPGLSSAWYRTPLDFISPYRRFGPAVHWAYYEQLTYRAHIPVFGREVKSRPWDRIPSDAWLVVSERPLLIPIFLLSVGFSAVPLAAWNFHFSTWGEKITWRACSVYNTFYSTALIIYYVHGTFQVLAAASAAGAPAAQSSACSPGVPQTTTTDRPELSQPNPHKNLRNVETCVALSENEAAPSRLRRLAQRGKRLRQRLRNISPDGDPDMELGLRMTFPPFVGALFYFGCRLFFYVEDFVSIREQPVGVYQGVNKFLPFIS